MQEHSPLAPSPPSPAVRVALGAPADFDFEHSLSFLCSFAPTRGEQRVAQGALTKVLSIEDHAVHATVRARAHGLVLEAHAARPLSEAAREALAERVRFQLSLDDDLRPFRALAEADVAFAPVARRWRGHHHVKFPSAFEIATWAVLAQRNQALGRRKKDALVHALGPSIAIEGIEHRAFPEPGRVLEAPNRLRAAIADDARADAILEIARAFAHPGFERQLRRAPIDVADAQLRMLPRIGPWSAAFVLFRGLGRMERLADASGPILAAAQGAYGPRTEREIRRIAEGYGTFCGYWALYLRRS